MFKAKVLLTLQGRAYSRTILGGEGTLNVQAQSPVNLTGGLRKKKVLL